MDPVLSQAEHDEERRKTEHSLSYVLIAMVLIFILCHSPRLILSVYESIVIKERLACIKNDKKFVPLWAMILICFNDFVLVLNSSINMPIYLCLNAKFRQCVANRRDLMCIPSCFKCSTNSESN